MALAVPLSASTAAAQTPATQTLAAELPATGLNDQGPEAKPVQERGFDHLVSDYQTRDKADYTAESWAPFAKALTAADDVADDTSATKSEVASAKTELMTAAADLERADGGTFQTITNDVFWNDTDGNPIYSQGGGVFKFGDTYYWYGVHYLGAESYRANPTRKYDNQVSFRSIPVYSSKDLVNWKFENRVATRSTGVGSGANLGGAGWVGRLGVTYNENTGKYVLAVQMWHPGRGGHGVLLLQGDSPTDSFDYGYFQTWVENSPTSGTGDQTVFTDDDGTDYLIFSNREGRSRAFVSKFRESDSLRIEPGVQIGRNSEGREGNAMFKLDGKYYHAASDLHGWNTSVNHVMESTSSNVQGDYTGEYTLEGTEMDYSHVTQTGFFVTVNGTEQNTVIYAGDRWADFAWNGIGYNQWVPITKTGSRPEFHSMSQWQFNVTTGEWRVGPQNNYILNPDIQADRIIVSNVRGWRRIGGWSTNVDGGANGSRFALQVGDRGGVEQRIESVPSGEYTLSLHARGSSGQVVVTGANGSERTLNVPSSGGWSKRELTGIELPSGGATVTVRASGSGGFTVDQLSLVKTDDGPPLEPPGPRYEAESAPAVCQGTIDSDHTGYSGTGFCNGDQAAGAYAQFTVTPKADAGTATVEVRFANGASNGNARPANLVVNGTTVDTVSFESTGAWSAWATKTLTVSLNDGNNTIRLDPTTAAGLPNVDYIEIGPNT
ncbi:family 43 glycosylhydrolase [Streptomyces sp. TRM68367]|uniref:family 43 glycosylhydrolase n=1 Tax=Streptomyces sp. TRM68367 TaxID=2758415 RepID=UPI00165B60EB|nr:family 43 glycosylhydrolase [Streptomyces sp. TRM68367]